MKIQNLLLFLISLILSEFSYSQTINYRSIGTNSGILFNTGNVSVSNGLANITFTNSLPSNVGQGDEITINGANYYILTATTLSATLQSNIAEPSGNYAFTIQRAYNSPSTWETSIQGNLVLDNRAEVGVCYNDGDFNTGLRISGSTTDISRNITLTVAPNQRHNGTAGTGVRFNNPSGGYGIYLQDDYCRAEWVEITNFTSGNGAGIQFDANRLLVENCLIYDFFTASNTVAGMKDMGGGSGDTAIIRNCIIYDGDREGVRCRSNHVFYIDNLTIFNMRETNSVGIKEDGGTVHVRNTISMGNINDYTVSNGTQSYNISSDATASGTGSLTNRSALNQFVSIILGNEDLHLKSGADALNVGTDLSSLFTIDIDNESRPQLAAWDIGADEATSAALPIELLYFDAEIENDIVKTSWSTASEINNDYFAIQRSQNAVNFEQIGTVQGAGNSSTILNYVFYDEHPYQGLSYYRLKQVDFDGTSTYSQIRAVYFAPFNLINVYPNPAQGFINIVFGAPSDMEIDIVVFNNLGQKVIDQKVGVLKGYHTINLNTASLSTGNYVFQITTPTDEHIEQEFIKK